MKKFIAFLILFIFLFELNISANLNDESVMSPQNLINTTSNFTVEAESAFLLEASTGEVLFKQNEISAAPPASVTKIMTLLLCCEAIDEGRISLMDKISISDHASSMGGSQVFLKEGEVISVEDLLKCTVIASANDAAVALAEHVFGSEERFVEEMNKRAKELKLTNTHFENVSGLDDTTINHYSCAKDIATMSRELISHNIILKYSSTWQDTIRNGEFTLTNTNRLVRYYDGCNGLKTGSTDKAGYCISVTAKRGNMQLIAVIMGAKTRDIRNTVARNLLDWGFSNFAIYKDPAKKIENVRIMGSKEISVDLETDDFSILVPKGMVNKVKVIYDIPNTLKAPIKRNDALGKIIYKIDDTIIGTKSIFCINDINKISFWDIFKSFLTELPFFK